MSTIDGQSAARVLSLSTKVHYALGSFFAATAFASCGTKVARDNVTLG